jgi:hypothetical protein
VLIFDHTIRRPPKPNGDENALLRGPVRNVHIDQSYTAAVNRVRYHLPDEAEELLKKRFQIINVRLPDLALGVVQTPLCRRTADRSLLSSRYGVRSRPS